MQPDLLNYQKPHYPDTAGYKEHTTSKEAAERIEASGAAEVWRSRVSKPSISRTVATGILQSVGT